jgi:hypothetical protein
MNEYLHDMSEEEEAAAGLGIVSDEEEAAPSTLIENLRAKRKEQSEEQTLLLELPGYNEGYPKLLAKYRLLEGHDVDRIGRNVTRETKDRWDRQMLTAIDIMIEACLGLYVDEGNGDEPHPLTWNNGNEITGFNEDLAHALQFEAHSARDVVFGLFGGRSHDLMIMEHNVRLGRWMGNTSRKVDEELLLGEA